MCWLSCRRLRDLCTTCRVAWKPAWSGCTRMFSKILWNSVQRRSGQLCCLPSPSCTWRCENEVDLVVQRGTCRTTAHCQFLTTLSDVCRITSTASNDPRSLSPNVIFINAENEKYSVTFYGRFHLMIVAQLTQSFPYSDNAMLCHKECSPEQRFR